MWRSKDNFCESDVYFYSIGFGKLRLAGTFTHWGISLDLYEYILSEGTEKCHSILSL